MGLMQRIRDLVGRDQVMRERGEQDAPLDPAQAVSRETGGGSDVGTTDANSTTGTTESGSFVGRAGSDESADVHHTGTDERNPDAVEGRTGAARDTD